MRLFFKHVLRSIKKSPLQSLIIALTLIVSVATFIIALKMAIHMQLENRAEKDSAGAACDISVKLSSADEIRMLFPDETEQIIGGDGQVLGEFSLTGITERDGKSELFSVCALDFEKADDFYGFRFTEYGSITEEKLKQSIIISTKTQETYGLKIGDTLSFRMLNRQFDFTVVAVALEDGALAKAEGLISIGAVSEALAAANPAIASLADSIVPYSVLRIRLHDKARVNEFVERLSSDQRFTGKQIINEKENVGDTDYFSRVSFSMISISAFIVIMLSGLTIATALHILSKKRQGETALFMICGADDKQIRGILYLECLLYSIIGAVGGLILSVPLIGGINRIFHWNIGDIHPKPYDALIALFGAPLIMLTTVYFRQIRAKKLTISELTSDQNQNRAEDAPIKDLIAPTALFLLFVFVTFLLSPKNRFVCGFFAIVTFLVLIYLLIPHVLRLIFKWLLCITEKRKRVPTKTLLTFKNISTSYPLMHTARLVTILLTLLYLMIICLSVLFSQIHTMTALVDCNYIAIGADMRTDASVEALDAVDDTFRLHFIQDMVTKENTGMLAISVSENAMEYVHPNIAPKKMPEGNEIVISSGIATLDKKSVGDEIVLKHETKEYTFKIIEVMDMHANIVFLDVGHMGISKQFLCIRSDSERNSEDFQSISNILEVRGAAIADRAEVTQTLTKRLVSYCRLMACVVPIAALTALLGIINVLISSHISRERERRIYYIMGMTKNQIRATSCMELLTLLAISFLLLFVFGSVVLYLFDISVVSFGVDVLF